MDKLINNEQQAHSNNQTSSDLSLLQPADIIIKQGDLETIVEETEEFTIADYSLIHGGRSLNG